MFIGQNKFQHLTPFPLITDKPVYVSKIIERQKDYLLNGKHYLCMLFATTGEPIWKAFFAFDRQTERWALSEVLTVQGRVSGTTQVM